MYILMGVVIFLTVVAVALLYISGRGKVTEPAPVKYEVRLYKTGEADISFPESYLQSDSEDEAVLDVVPDTMVELIVSPKEGKELESVSVMDHQFNSINTQRSRTAAEDERVLFPMPEKDVLVSFRFRDLETEKAAETRTGQGPEIAGARDIRIGNTAADRETAAVWPAPARARCRYHYVLQRDV